MHCLPCDPLWLFLGQTRSIDGRGKTQNISPPCFTKGKSRDRIQEAAPLDGYRVRLKLTNSRVIERDLAEHLAGPVFSDIRSSPERFREFRVESGTLVWPGGADLCPDVLIWGGLPPADAVCDAA